jgi:hypothetical protein
LFAPQGEENEDAHLAKMTAILAKVKNAAKVQDVDVEMVEDSDGEDEDEDDDDEMDDALAATLGEDMDDEDDDDEDDEDEDEDDDEDVSARCWSRPFLLLTVVLVRCLFLGGGRGGGSKSSFADMSCSLSFVHVRIVCPH